MPWYKDIVRAIRDNAAYDIAKYVILGALLLAWPFVNGLLATVWSRPWYWKINGGLIFLAIVFFIVALAQALRLQRLHKSSLLQNQQNTNPKVELQSESGLIAARITNRSDSEIRIEDLWIASIDVRGTKTEAKTIRKHKFKRCNGMPHVMPPRSSFEVTFTCSEGTFLSERMRRPQFAPTEYWIDVKLEDGTIVSSQHQELPIPKPTERPLGVTEVIDEAMRRIREDKVTFTLYALQKAGVGSLNSEEEFLDVCEAIIQRNEPDPTKDLSIAKYGLTWIELVRFANRKGIDLYSPTAVYDCIQQYVTRSSPMPVVENLSTEERLAKYGAAVVPPQQSPYAARRIPQEDGKAPIELMDDLIREGEQVEKFCGDMSNGEEARTKVDSWIEKTRTTLRKYASDYVATFNEAVEDPLPSDPFPKRGRTANELGEWYSNETRREAWRLAAACLERIKLIRTEIRSKLP